MSQEQSAEIDRLNAVVRRLEGELMAARFIRRCRVCDTAQGGTIYCYECYRKALEPPADESEDESLSDRVIVDLRTKVHELEAELKRRPHIPTDTEIARLIARFQTDMGVALYRMAISPDGFQIISRETGDEICDRLEDWFIGIVCRAYSQL